MPPHPQRSTRTRIAEHPGFAAKVTRPRAETSGSAPAIPPAQHAKRGDGSRSGKTRARIDASDPRDARPVGTPRQGGRPRAVGCPRRAARRPTAARPGFRLYLVRGLRPSACIRLQQPYPLGSARIRAHVGITAQIRNEETMFSPCAFIDNPKSAVVAGDT